MRDGFTRRLKERVESVRGKGLGSEECVEVAGRVEGGYGGSVELRKKDGVVIFAGEFKTIDKTNNKVDRGYHLLSRIYSRLSLMPKTARVGQEWLKSSGW